MMLQTGLRIISALLIGGGALFYLQFGVQALFQSPPQGALAVFGAGVMGWAAFLAFRRRPASLLIFWGTVPLALLHVVYTMIDLQELPFLIGSLPVPVLASVAWTVGRRKVSASPAT